MDQKKLIQKNIIIPPFSQFGIMLKWIYQKAYHVSDEEMQRLQDQANQEAESQMNAIIPYLDASFKKVFDTPGPVIINVEDYDACVCSLVRKELYAGNNIRKYVKISLLKNKDGERIMKFERKHPEKWP